MDVPTDLGTGLAFDTQGDDDYSYPQFTNTQGDDDAPAESWTDIDTPTDDLTIAPGKQT